MTCYRVPVSDELLLSYNQWLPVDGFRLVRIEGPSSAQDGVTICLFEDDNAPAGLEGRLVDPTFTKRYDDDGRVVGVTITDRRVIG